MAEIPSQVTESVHTGQRQHVLLDSFPEHQTADQRINSPDEVKPGEGEKKNTEEFSALLLIATVQLI